jgi:FkbM family methyltransferase
MDSFYLFFYRVFSACQERLAALDANRMPNALKKARRAIRLAIERSVLPKHRLSVRVLSGLSEGLWIRAQLPEEASYWKGKRERLTEKAILANVGEGAVVFDVGAHIGVVTFGAARLVGKTGRVVAFDSDPENVASLREACVLNHFEQNVQVVHAAVWSYTTDRGVSFRRGATRRSHGGVAADGYQPVLADGPTLTVPATTLDAFIACSGLTPKLVKIDVEGGEYEVLRGGEALFANVRPYIVMEVHDAEAFEQISHWIQDLRYSPQWSIPKQGYPRMLFARPAEFRSKSVCPPPKKF